MREGDIVLAYLPQADGSVKQRPALILRRVPPFGDALVCGLSRQLHLVVEGLDEIIREGDADFNASGLDADSLIRLCYLSLMPPRRLVGGIGKVAAERHSRLLLRLSQFLVARHDEA